VEKGKNMQEVDFPSFTSICQDLKTYQYSSDTPSNFEGSIKDAFRFLGFSGDLIGGSGETDVLIIANIGEEAFKINVDGKTSKSGKISDRQIDWISLQDHQKKTKANHVVVVGPDFSGGNLLTRAEEYNICLLKTDELIQLVKSHEKFPFTLLELRDLFSGAGLRTLQVEDLILQNEARRDLLENFVYVLEEMQSLQDRLGYFTFESLAGRERLEELEIEPSDVKDIIELLKLPFLNAIHNLSETKYILVSKLNNLSNIFKHLSNMLRYSEDEILKDEKESEIVFTKEIERLSGTKYFSWENRGQSIAAYARKEKPYVHHCPIDHFNTIFTSIVDNLQENPLISVSTIFTDLEERGLAPGRPFKGRAEDYKIRMVLGILEIEGLLKWTGSKSPIEYSANEPLENFQNWFSNNF
jgi:hypothetical protein